MFYRVDWFRCIINSIWLVRDFYVWRKNNVYCMIYMLIIVSGIVVNCYVWIVREKYILDFDMFGERGV